jgi:hypothetical protein
MFRMRESTIIESMYGDQEPITHVQDMTTGQIWRADNRGRRGKGPFMPGRLRHVSNIKPNKYDYRPAGKR